MTGLQIHKHIPSPVLPTCAGNVLPKPLVLLCVISASARVLTFLPVRLPNIFPYQATPLLLTAPCRIVMHPTKLSLESG